VFCVFVRLDHARSRKSAPISGFVLVVPYGQAIEASDNRSVIIFVGCVVVFLAPAFATFFAPEQGLGIGGPQTIFECVVFWIMAPLSVLFARCLAWPRIITTRAPHSALALSIYSLAAHAVVSALLALSFHVGLHNAVSWNESRHSFFGMARFHLCGQCLAEPGYAVCLLGGWMMRPTESGGCTRRQHVSYPRLIDSRLP
jgi:hypothetical protein